MNNDRRKAIARIVNSITEFCDEIDDIIVDEECAFSRMPDSIRESREFQFRKTIDSITEAQDKLIEAQVLLESAI